MKLIKSVLRVFFAIIIAILMYAMTANGGLAIIAFVALVFPWGKRNKKK